MDIFSYAMLLFELLTGERPFEELQTISEMNEAITKGERPSLDGLNGEPYFPEMIDLMHECWIHSPAQRPSANEVCMAATYLQWDLSIMTTLGPEDVRYTEMFGILKSM